METQTIISVYKGIREALNTYVVGYEEFKDALVVAHFKRLLGLRGHLLVYGPPGVAKTVASKAFASLVNQAAPWEKSATYIRTSGRSDLMPEEILAERVAEYDDAGHLEFGWQMQTVQHAIADFHVIPVVWQFDEADKVTPRTLHALLEIMEEQQYTMPDGMCVPLNFMLLATANMRRYDKTAQEIPTPVKDRLAVVLHNGFLSEAQDLRVLDFKVDSTAFNGSLPEFPTAREIVSWQKEIQEEGLPVITTEEIRRGIVRTAKLTQEKIPGYTDFASKVKVPSGPRGYLSFYEEAAVHALLRGAKVIQPQDCMAVGVRVFRGRVEVTPEAEMEGKSIDALMVDILAEVFGEVKPQSGEGETSQVSEDPADENQEDNSGADGHQQSAGFRLQLRKEMRDPDVAPTDAEKDPKASESDPERGRDSAETDQQPRVGEEPSGSGQNGDETPQEGSESGGDSQDQSGEQGESGENDSGSNSGSCQKDKSDGQESGDGSHDSSASVGKGNGSEEGSGTGQGQGDTPSDSSEGSSQSQESDSQEAGRGQSKSTRSIVDNTTLANHLASQPTRQFKTAEGLKTGAELAKDLATGQPQRFDAVSTDGKLQIRVRGNKSIAEGDSGEMVSLADLQSQSEISQQKQEEKAEMQNQTGQGQSGIASKLDPKVFALTGGYNLPKEVISILPALREIDAEQRIETLQNWFNSPVAGRSHSQIEYRLLKGMAHVDAVMATRAFDQIFEGERTLTRAGERVDFVTGHDLRSKLSPTRTALRVAASGGVLDHKSEVREVRVETDAPHLLFVLDASGSMNYENRMASCAAATYAVANYYGPKGATFGFVVFKNGAAVVVHPPEPDVDRVFDAILSVEPGWGTSYPSGLELAYRVALPRTTCMVLGDFIDSSVPSASVLGLKAQKEIKTIGIVGSAGNPDYAGSICDEVSVVNWVNGADVALTALEALSR